MGFARVDSHKKRSLNQNAGVECLFNPSVRSRYIMAQWPSIYKLLARVSIYLKGLAVTLTNICKHQLNRSPRRIGRESSTN